MRRLSIVLGIIVGATLFATLGVGQDQSSAPVEVFADLEGTWTGTFIGYDETGNELYRIAVTQRYQTLNDTMQKVIIYDKMADGRVISGSGINTARRREDGSLDLRCTIDKSNGQRVAHQGRVVIGPNGDQQIVWYSSGPDRVETFREVVRREGSQVIYEINGMGRYGETLILMHGRYIKQRGEDDPTTEKEPSNDGNTDETS
ncbi:MAG: hypothetical protein O7C67_06220 [Gammaproteobacteria bacterium]|nr:hypothetical protein [Gammaproteobacteria bacterium]